MTDGRARVLRQVAAMVPEARDRGHPVRVAVDGVDGAGKTTFADELAEILREDGRHVVRASVDGFHRPAAERYRRGRTSPQGFFLDSYDLDTLRAVLLDPAGPDHLGPRRVRTAVRDVTTDSALDVPWTRLGPTTVVLVDGIFLHRDELVEAWDLSVWIDAPFDVTYARMARRDGCPPDPHDPANTRYRDGQLLYLAACSPVARADVVVDNSDLASPRLLRRPQEG